MSDLKVLHEFEDKEIRYRLARTGRPRTVQLQWHDDKEWFFDHEPDDRLVNLILRLSAELARARAEGRLEGMQEIEQAAWKEFAGQDPAWTEVSALMNRLIAAAERELGEEQ